MIRKIRFVISTLILYSLTIGALGYTLNSDIFSSTVQAKKIEDRQIVVAKTPKIISGKPIRIVIPDYNIDLPVLDGKYDKTTSSWTLSKTNAHYATMTELANDTSGNTLIYGHGTDEVFGKLNTVPPSVETRAEIHTDNKHIFKYKFIEARQVTPNDTSVLSHSSTPPSLTIQTCTGIFNEWRTLFRFEYESLTK